MERIFPLQFNKSAGAEGQFSGYAAVFGNVDSDGEVVDKGAFSASLRKSGGVYPILWQHDRAQPCGWSRSASEDENGLKFTGELMVNTEPGRVARSFMRKAAQLGASAGLQIGFTVPEGGSYIKSGIRHFKQIDLREVSIVTFAANDLARVTSAKDGLGLAPEAIRRAVEQTRDHLAAARDMHLQAGERLQAAYNSFAPIPAYLRNDVNAPNPVGGQPKSDDAALRLLREAEELSELLEM